MRSIIHLLPLFIFCAVLVACKSDQTTAIVNEGLKKAQDAYAAAPDVSSANAVISEVLKALKSDLPASDRQGLLQYGYDVATQQNIASRAAGFLFPLIKEAKTPATADQLFNLGNLLKKLNKGAAANTIFQGIVDGHAGFGQMDKVKAAISEPITSIDAYIMALGEKLFVDADNTGINKEAALKYVDACEAYGLAYPNGENTADNLFKAAEVAKSIRTFPKSLSLYDWILDKYPNYEKAPTALFLKGFIIENNLKDDDKAREIYNSFLAKYPNNDLADDVEFLIENLGKTDEEILQMIEEKRKAKEAEAQQ